MPRKKHFETREGPKETQFRGILASQQKTLKLIGDQNKLIGELSAMMAEFEQLCRFHWVVPEPNPSSPKKKRVKR